MSFFDLDDLVLLVLLIVVTVVTTVLAIFLLWFLRVVRGGELRVEKNDDGLNGPPFE